MTSTKPIHLECHVDRDEVLDRLGWKFCCLPSVFPLELLFWTTHMIQIKCSQVIVSFEYKHLFI